MDNSSSDEFADIRSLPPITLHLLLDTDAEPEDIEKATLDLRDSISSSAMPITPTVPISDDLPTGAKPGSALEWGTIILALGGSGGTLAALLGLLKEWLHVRGNATIRVKISDDEIELTGASRPERSGVIEAFIQRHDNPTAPKVTP